MLKIKDQAILNVVRNSDSSKLVMNTGPYKIRAKKQQEARLVVNQTLYAQDPPDARVWQ